MKNFKLSKFNALLKIEYTEEDNIWLTSGYTLRKLVGILGMALPILLYVFLYIDSGIKAPLDSISHYYFTRVAGIFIVILGAMAIFLMVYKGKKSVDFYISFIAGMFAMLVCLFPTTNISDICHDVNKEYSVTILRNSGFRPIFHYISAGIFLLSLAYMSLFLFTKSDKKAIDRGPRKKLRNRIYRTCGVIMTLALLIIFLGFLKVIPTEFYEKNHLTFWMEAVAIESFGFSWLIKGNTLFKDK